MREGEQALAQFTVTTMPPQSDWLLGQPDKYTEIFAAVDQKTPPDVWPGLTVVRGLDGTPLLNPSN